MLTTNEICNLCLLPWGTLTSWVKRGRVTPTIKGSKGRGNAHSFSDRQALALAMIAALHQSDLGCGPAWVKKYMRMYEEMDDAAFNALLCPKDDYGDEAEAAWMGRVVRPILGIPANRDEREPRDPADEAIVDDIIARQLRVRREIVRRMNAQASRMMNRPAPSRTTAAKVKREAK